MRLTESEKQDIIRCIEADKPLAEKYRWLLFADKRQVELVWNGKTTAITKTVLPFQTIEVVAEPRAENTTDKKIQPNHDLDERSRQIAGWKNKLIWGDNKLILSSLKDGVLRKEIEKAGGIKLIYIDPPFDVGADFSMKLEVGDNEFNKNPNILRELAYRDIWGKGTDSFIAMIYERLRLMYDLLADDGNIYVHCDWRVSSHLRFLLNEIFGIENFVNEIIWSYKTGGIGSRWFSRKHDTIYLYCKNDNYIFTPQEEKSYLTSEMANAKIGSHTSIKYGLKKDEKGTYRMATARDVWEMLPIYRNSPELLKYPTQKPEALLERIIKASSNENDLIADFFCGSGTTLAVAEKLGRKWIGSDLGQFAIHTTRKRMISVQRELKKSGKNFRAFEILNLGKYERQYYIGINTNLHPDLQAKQLAQKRADFVKLITRAYNAERIDNFKTFVSKKAGRMIAIGPINLPASQQFVETVINECTEKKITKVDILAFEFEMGLFPNIQEEAKDKGIDLALKYIPQDVFDKRAIEKNQVVFHDVAYIEVKAHVKPAKKGSPSTIAVEFTNFSVYYNQDSSVNVIEKLKANSHKTVVEQGNIIKITKDKKGNVTRELLTKEWTDWIDYWSVDFNFENKKEMLRIKNEDGKIEEQWTGDYIFENEWQSFRTKKDRSIELKSTEHECRSGKRKIAVKVVDIFGNDTMKVVEVTI